MRLKEDRCDIDDVFKRSERAVAGVGRTEEQAEETAQEERAAFPSASHALIFVARIRLLVGGRREGQTGGRGNSDGGTKPSGELDSKRHGPVTADQLHSRASEISKPLPMRVSCPVRNRTSSYRHSARGPSR